MARKTTSREIAEAAGVSPATVDRVLNERGGVAPETEKLVIEWARRLQHRGIATFRPARTLRIAVLLQAPSNPFHAKVRSEFERANHDFSALNMQFKFFHIEPQGGAKTAEIVRRVLPSHDGLVICSAHHASIAEACREFARKGPVVTLATEIPDSGRIAYIGPDNRRAGRVAGDLMGRFLGPQGGEVVMIAGLLSMLGHEEREMGFRSVLRERYPQCRVSAVFESLEQSRRAGDLVRDALAANPAIRGIYNASAGARDVVAALSDLGRSDIVSITHELTDERRALLRQGLVDAVIDQNPEAEVRATILCVAEAFGRASRLSDRPSPMIQIHTIENS